MGCRNHPDKLDGIKLCARCQQGFCGECLTVVQNAPVCSDCAREVEAMAPPPDRPPAPPPSRSACANHPDKIDGLKNCSRCQRTYCGDCLVELQGAPVCAACKEQVVRDVRSGVESEVTGDKQLSPWDRRREIGVVRAIRETTVGVMFHPIQFFSSIYPVGRHGATLGYGVLVGSIWGAIGQLTTYAVQMAIIGGVSGAAGQPGVWEAMLMGGGMGLLALPLIPLQMILGLYLYSGLCHLGLLIARSKTNGFEATYRTVSYCQSISILAVIPFLGGMVAGVWMIVAWICGLKAMHRTTGGKAAFAALWFIGLCCVLVLGFAVMIPLAARSSSGF